MAEDDDIEESLIISWWNSKTMTHRGGSDAAGRQHQIDLAVEVVFYLLRKGADILALGEVDSASFQAISYLLPQNGFNDFATLFCGEASTGESPKGRFDIGIIYKESKISSIEPQYIEGRYAGAKLKVGVRLNCIVGKAEDTFYFFISHWPSRLRGDAKVKRDAAAAKLKNSADSVRDETNKFPYVIILGDFNDEPFDTSISDRLQASRDRVLAAKSNELFYNPYWRHLGSESTCAPESITDSEPVMGTCFFAHAGQMSRWFTFDQILFSSAFLGNSDWTIDETKTAVERPDMLKGLIKEKVFDHFPVTGKMLKLTKGQRS